MSAHFPIIGISQVDESAAYGELTKLAVIERTELQSFRLTTFGEEVQTRGD